MPDTELTEGAAPDTDTSAPARRRAAAKVPGACTEAPAPADAPAAPAPTAHESRHSLPDFRHKSEAAAKAWFDANPLAKKRAVLTHDGWYVPPGAMTGRAEKTMAEGG